MDNLLSFFFRKRQQMHFNRSMKIKGGVLEDVRGFK